MPETSTLAFHAREASGANSTNREDALRALTKYGPGTCLEIHRRMLETDGVVSMAKSDLSTRFNELRIAGLAAQIGKRKSFGTGHLSVLWSVRDAKANGAAPVRLSKAGRIRELEEEMLGLKLQLKLANDLLDAARTTIRDFHAPLFN
jgi:hypothetical protein